VVYFFRDVMGFRGGQGGVEQTTGEYRGWVEAFARNHKIQWNGPKRCPKEEYVAWWPHGAGRPVWRLFHFQAWSKADLSLFHAKFPPRNPFWAHSTGIL